MNMRVLFLVTFLLLSIYANAQYLSSGQRKQISAMIRDSIAPLKARIAALEAKIIVTEAKGVTTETTANKNTKSITTIQGQITALQKLDTVKGTGSIRIARVGITAQLQITNDSATATKQGNLTPYYRKLITDLKAQITALQNQSTSLKKEIAKMKTGLSVNPTLKEKLTIVEKKISVLEGMKIKLKEAVQ